ncbi:efflux transporter periplasmic adaptor subunit [Flavobacterium cyanobacteriorum]|uniref:Efflux transporter periplasmic adaptor subunit n=1 Tax=Flavobacterium cyanobacteriorum TaxID=2022802 RepID=A0A255Z9Z6_9FLAO|nr:efflux RND transporter periplasmic adaptor subunit [Flavobacterium cyanobacteriorum]OYQ38276.1 efflux transporter periplasmic adaptor subunit [Flavobacterium cyanobacteriorum]
MKKTLLYILIAAVSVGLIVYILSGNKAKNEAETEIVSKKNPAVAVRTAEVKTGTPNEDYIANGTFEPVQELSFPAENSGRVVRVLVDEGDAVRKGQVLATIKGDQLSVELTNAQAAYNNAITDRQRYENAFQTGGVTRQQLDQAKLTVANAKARLDQAKLNFGDATIKSSINGTVNKRYIEPGSVVSPGTNLFDLVDVSKLKLKVTVNEQQVANLKQGAVVKVTASVFPDKEFKGRISFIAPKADESLNFPIEIEVAGNPDNQLRAGMYGSAVFSNNTAKQAPIKTIPRNAFIGGVGNNQVFVVKDSVAKLTKIVSGRILGEEVEVVSGLNNGDVVVVSGQINLQDGTKVAPIK